jgi:hypothetical protein
VPFNPIWRRAATNAVIPLLGGVPSAPGAVFMAYPYARDPAYRDMLRRVAALVPPVRFVFPEDDPSSAHLSEKVLALLENVSFAIFDWSTWNANVAFEFGLALGVVQSRPASRGAGGPSHRRENIVIVVQSGTETDVPSDLGGMGRTRYTDLDDLETKLVGILRGRFPPRR